MWSILGLSDEDSNQVIIKQFMAFLETEYQRELDSVESREILKKKKVADDLRKETWADKSRSGVQLSVGSSSRIRSSVSFTSPEPSDSQLSDSQSSSINLSSLSSGSVRSSDLSIESLSELIEKLDNLKYYLYLEISMF